MPDPSDRESSHHGLQDSLFCVRVQRTVTVVTASAARWTSTQMTEPSSSGECAPSREQKLRLLDSNQRPGG